MADGEKDMFYVLIFPILLWRWLHSQIWISFARFQTARTKHLIVNKGIDFEQVDRERNWLASITLSDAPNSLIYVATNMCSQRVLTVTKSIPGPNYIWSASRA